MFQICGCMFEMLGRMFEICGRMCKSQNIYKMFSLISKHAFAFSKLAVNRFRHAAACLHHTFTKHTVVRVNMRPHVWNVCLHILTCGRMSKSQKSTKCPAAYVKNKLTLGYPNLARYFSIVQLFYDRCYP